MLRESANFASLHERTQGVFPMVSTMLSYKRPRPSVWRGACDVMERLPSL